MSKFKKGGFAVLQGFFYCLLPAVFCLLSAGNIYAQEGAFTAGQAATYQAPAGITQGSPTPAQRQAAESLSPAQQKAVQAEISKTGGQLTPEAIEALKKSPEFKDIKPEDVQKGKELLEKKDTEKGEEKKIEEKPKETAKSAVSEGEGSLFDRYISDTSPLEVSTRLKPFGYDLFTGVSLTPPQDMPVASDYAIGPGDEISILLWGRLSGQYLLTVSRDGTIQFPNIGPLSVAGMTFEEMKRFLTRQTKNIVGAEINVTMGRLRSIQVFVLGEVKKPGAYTVSAMSTLTNALMASGGPTLIGSLRKVELKRNSNKTATTMDFYDLLLKGDKSKDLRLQNGDVIFVPTVGPIVGIAGNVKRPAVYELKDDSGLAGVLELAGGIIPTAYTQQIQVERIEKNERRIVIDINDRESGAVKNFMLQDADLVKVFSIVGKDANVVYLNGNVKRPGKYEIKKGMRLKDVIKDESELLDKTYFDYALIKRLVPPTLEAKLIPFNPGNLLFKGSQEDNMELVPQDSIYIFPTSFFKDRPTVSIEGEVRNGGRFPYEKDMTIKDLVLLGGGATKESFLTMAELIRVNENREYQTIYFNLEKALAEDKDENLSLKDEDKIILHSIWEDKWKESVVIEGEIKKPGTYLLTEEIKIKDLIFKSGGITRDTYLVEAELYRTNWRTKEITLHKFSLAKAMDGDEANNVKLQDKDRVVIHSVWENIPKQYLTVSGDVNKPGQYPYASNMTIKDLIFASGNLLESAYLEEAELTSHTVKDGRLSIVSHKKIDMRKVIADDPEHNVLLKPYDSLFIRKISEWKTEKYVEIKGEAVFPGRYLIKKGERLSSIIERAGGFTDKAYLQGVVFTRESVKELQQKNINDSVDRLEQQLLSQTSLSIQVALTADAAQQQQAVAEQQKALITKMRAAKSQGRMVIRFDEMEGFEGSSYDIELEDGDTLSIPERPNSIQVIGSVYNSTAFIYDPKATLSAYIDKAGGTTRYAEGKDIFVLKSDGSAIARRQSGMFFMSSKLDPGDTIVVPEKVERIAWMREIKDLTQILYQIAVTAGVLIVAF